MTTSHFWADLRHVLRWSVAPAAALSAAIGSLQLWGPWPGSPVTPALLVSVTTAWLLTSMAWAGTRPRRDRRAAQRLATLRTASQARNRALVHVHAILRESLAGQLVDVVNVETGGNYRIWLPETNLPVGSFALLERSTDSVTVVGWLQERSVEAAHRADASTRVTVAERTIRPGKVRGERDSGDSLVRQVEEYLRSQR